MTQEEKDLLLKDLCARLPYGVKVLDNSRKNYGVSKLINIGVDGSMLIDNEIKDIQYYPIIDETKPYLRLLSSMTEEESKEYTEICTNRAPYMPGGTVDFFNAHHFDYHGLIEKGIALEASENMYK